MRTERVGMKIWSTRMTMAIHHREIVDRFRREDQEWMFLSCDTTKMRLRRRLCDRYVDRYGVNVMTVTTTVTAT